MTTQGSPPRALSHPLPAGMRDLLPREAQKRRALSERVLSHFALHGFHLVTMPAFELAEVLERGLGTLDPADVLRFIEPGSGEVAALRPDVTPQIARMVATRLAGEPRPIRLCYEGTVLRRSQGHARRDRQIPQAGVELYGVSSMGGDIEILRLAGSVIRHVGLEDFLVDLGHARIASSLLEAFSPDLAAEIADALALKDAARVDDLLSGSRSASVDKRIAAAVAALPDLASGGPSGPSADAVFARGAKLFEGTGAEGPLRELVALWDAASRPVPLNDGEGEEHLASVMRVDLGDLRGFAYYTGPVFHVLAEGPGEPIAAGGRYDNLLARFDAPMPAVGFALQLDALRWARETAGIVEPEPPRVLVASGPSARRIAALLRAGGIAAAVYEGDDAERYAAAWQFSHLVTHGPEGTSFWQIGGAPAEGSPKTLGAETRAADLVQQMMSAISQKGSSARSSEDT